MHQREAMRVLQTTTVLLAASTSVCAFSTQKLAQPQSTALNLFGKGGTEGAAKKGPGMMDQIAMFKKAQEMAQKKQKIDEELKKMDFSGEGADGKVKASFKYVPVQNPMDPNPDYEAVSFEFDADYYESASPEDLAAAVKDCITNGIETTNQVVAEKYSALQGDLMQAFGQKPAEEES
mmetsp:Transcript_12971/g.35907  ORF Transcript_12971/g.35907 Transcript_12971/m.35907 type:complete len:178 (-) Transcript_12971:50-583(-)